jgi:hypothetical protein
MKEYVEFIGYIVLIGVLCLICHVFEVGPQQAAYEAGATLSNLKAGFVDGGAQGVSHLNQVFQDPSK